MMFYKRMIKKYYPYINYLHTLHQRHHIPSVILNIEYIHNIFLYILSVILLSRILELHSTQTSIGAPGSSPPPHTEKTYYDASRYIHQSLVYTVKNKKIKNDIILCLKIKLKLQISLFDLNTLFKPVIYCGNFTKI